MLRTPRKQIRNSLKDLASLVGQGIDARHRFSTSRGRARRFKTPQKGFPSKMLRTSNQTAASTKQIKFGGPLTQTAPVRSRPSSAAQFIECQSTPFLQGAEFKSVIAFIKEDS